MLLELTKNQEDKEAEKEDRVLIEKELIGVIFDREEEILKEA